MIHYIAMIVFALMGQFNLWVVSGSPWVGAFWVATAIVFLCGANILMKKIPLRDFFITSLIYLVTGSAFILLDYKVAYHFLSEGEAVLFFALYFVILVIHFFLEKINPLGVSRCWESLGRAPSLKVASMGLILVIAYSFKEYGILLSAVLPYLLVRLAIHRVDRQP